MKRILVIGRIDEVLINNLTATGFNCDCFDALSSDELIKKIEPYYGLVVRTYVINKEIIDAGKNLKFIARAGSGLEKIDIDYAKQKGIAVLNSPEGNADAVAEHAVGMLLNMLHNISKSNNEIKNWQFNRIENTGFELGSRTVGIIGYGNTGSRFASKLSGFGCRMLAYDKYKTDFENELVKEATLDEVFKQADIVSFHIPYNEETHHLVGESFVNKFSKPNYVINTSRGSIVNSVEIVKILTSEKINGLALDVFENEKYNSLNSDEKNIMQQLIDSKKCLLTPHTAGWSFESDYKIAEILSKKIQEYVLMSN